MSRVRAPLSTPFFTLRIAGKTAFWRELLHSIPIVLVQNLVRNCRKILEWLDHLYSWWRKDRQSWYVTIHGKRHKLGPNKVEAQKSKPRRNFRNSWPISILSEGGPSEPAIVLMDKLPHWVSVNRAATTLDWYTIHLQSFVTSLIDQAILASDIKPFHITEWAEDKRSAAHWRAATATVQPAFR